jgi:hypothetical protein
MPLNDETEMLGIHKAELQALGKAHCTDFNSEH